jgi:hypothetical protein
VCGLKKYPYLQTADSFAIRVYLCKLQQKQKQNIAHAFQICKLFK